MRWSLSKARGRVGGLQWEGLQGAIPALSPGASTRHHQVQCGLLDLVSGLGLPSVGAARGHPLPHLGPGSQGRRRRQTDRWTGANSGYSAQYQGPQGSPGLRVSPTRRESPPCSQEPSLRGKTFHGEESPGTVK